MFVQIDTNDLKVFGGGIRPADTPQAQVQIGIDRAQRIS